MTKYGIILMISQNRGENMKKVIFIIIIALLLFALYPFANDFFNTSDKQGEDVVFSVANGESAKTVAKNLKNSGLIKSEILFSLKLKATNSTTKIHSGTFNLNTGMSLSTIIRKLTTEGGGESFTLVVPEGYSAEQIAQKLEQNGIMNADMFLAALSDDYNYDFIGKIPKRDLKYKLQGFLFPQTYEFFKNASAHEIIDTMLKEFEKQYAKIADVKNIDYDTIVLASLVEREAKLDSERGKIAGVIKNRLNENMLLQIDATVVYAISDGLYNVDKVYYKDLENTSPYNTYKYKGLPVGAICNPGIKSIKAALMPDIHKYKFYHTDENKKDGSHIFTENYDEHMTTQ